MTGYQQAMARNTLSNNMMCFLAQTTLENMRDVREELGLALWQRKEYAEKARKNIDRRNTGRFARSVNVVRALESRERVQYLRKLLVQMRGY